MKPPKTWKPPQNIQQKHPRPPRPRTSKTFPQSHPKTSKHSPQNHPKTSKQTPQNHPKTSKQTPQNPKSEVITFVALNELIKSPAASLNAKTRSVKPWRPAKAIRRAFGCLGHFGRKPGCFFWFWDVLGCFRGIFGVLMFFLVLP